ncbi:hypothetical protein VNO77_00455 [Canavalia gladiata]|uniref:Uncharacterized protein n=1 Tax=Canavalia gladiata TaxID=3824 RepID=A0AAN9MVW0_CANGL
MGFEPLSICTKGSVHHHLPFLGPLLYLLVLVHNSWRVKSGCYICTLVKHHSYTYKGWHGNHAILLWFAGMTSGCKLSQTG